MTGVLANGYSFESTQRELSNEYQHDRVSMLFRNLCVRVLWTKVISALKGLRFVFARNNNDNNNNDTTTATTTNNKSDDGD